MVQEILHHSSFVFFALFLVFLVHFIDQEQNGVGPENLVWKVEPQKETSFVHVERRSVSLKNEEVGALNFFSFRGVVEAACFSELVELLLLKVVLKENIKEPDDHASLILVVGSEVF